jgi:hypothetical protein
MGKLLARRMIGTCDELWKSQVITSTPSQLAKLESIVADLENAIPSGTSCRQVNLKVDLSVPERSLGAQSGRRLSFFTDTKGPDRQDLLSDVSKEPVDPGKGITDMLMGDGWMPSRTKLSTKRIESSIDRLLFSKYTHTTDDAAFPCSEHIQPRRTSLACQVDCLQRLFVSLQDAV